MQFVGLKVLDGNGGGRTSDVIRAIEFAIANKNLFGIGIINLSLGHPIFEPAARIRWCWPSRRRSKAGIIVVASAGNHGVDENGEEGYAGTTSPGNAPSAITAGAFDHKATVDALDDRMAVYSSRGPTWFDGLAKPDVVAPGHFLASEAAPTSSLFMTYPRLRQRGKAGKRYMRLSGTSMAAAVTTGVVALLKQTQPALTPNLAKGLLQFTAVPLHDDDGARYDVLTQGTGGINAAGALKLLRHIDPTVTSLEQP